MVLFDVALCLFGLTPYDRATLESSVVYVFNKNNCDQKIKALTTRGVGKAEATRRIKTSCSQHKLFGETEEYEYWTCPCRIYNPATTFLIQATLAYKNGILPHSGGLFDQNATIMEGVEMVGRILNELEEKERKLERSKNGRKR